MPADINGGCLLLVGLGVLAALLLSWLIALLQTYWLFLGAIAILIWGGRAWREWQQQQRSRQLWLQQTFYRLLQEHQGRLTVFDFAVQTNLSGAEARDYLNARAREFYANFEPSDRGDILYIFPMLKATMPVERDCPDAPADAD